MNSAIYTGKVQHRRFTPKAHHFQYQAFMMYLDLDELPTLFNQTSTWSYGKANFAYFKRSDYFGDADKPLKSEILAKVAQDIDRTPAGKICVLTNMRYFGHCFNPVSFYYCYAADNQTLEAIVTHITNTPWGKDYAYVHDCIENWISGKQASEHQSALNQPESKQANLKFHLRKAFHVSPFMPMEIEYDWQFSIPGNKLNVYMQNHQIAAGKLVFENTVTKMFDATLTLQRVELSPTTLNRILIKYPLMTMKVIAAIYWQALLLWLKRVPFYPYPATSNKE